MSNRRSDELISKLGASLAKAPPAPPTPAPLPAGEENAELAAKISISLYTDDLDRVDAIIAHMAQNRCRVNRSEAIKLALRGVKLTSEMVDMYREIQRDDGRRKKSPAR